MSSKDYAILLSICIPSYNRGHRAYSLVKSILDAACIAGRNDIEVILSDNGSTLHTEEYDLIEKIKDKRLICNRFDENKQYYGNYNAIVKMSRGHFCLLVSDEDSIDMNVLPDLIGFLESSPAIGMMKVRSTFHYCNYEPGLAHAGEDALKRFYLSGNYISGVVYNRDYVTDELIDGLLNLYESDKGYYYYPHLFVEAYILNLADFWFFDRCLIIEGDDEGDIPKAEKASIPVFASWESRIEQMRGYFKLISDLRIDEGRKQLMFMMAVCKTISLIALVRESYETSGISWDDVYVSAGNGIIRAVENCGIDVIASNIEAYGQVVADFIRKDLR